MNKRWIVPVGIALAIGAIAVTPGVHDTRAEGNAVRKDGRVRFVPDNLFAVSFVNGKRGWAAGYYGTVLQTTDGGASWVRRPLAANDLIRRIRFVDDRTGWAVSHRGKIFFTQDGGSNWVVQHEMPGVYLRDIFMTDRENGWVVGHGKTILRTTDGGRNWTPQTFAHKTQDPPRLNGIAAYDAMNAVAVGEFGLILKTSDGGATWTQITSPAATTYSAVAVAANHAVAIGLGGVLTYLPRGSGAAKLIQAPAPLHLLDVALDKAGNGFVVGAGSAYRIEGELVHPVNIDVPQGSDLVWLAGVALTPDRAALAVGSGGLITKYDPATQSFKQTTDWAG